MGEPHFNPVDLNPYIVKMLPKDLVEKYHCIAVALTDNQLTLAIEDPTEVHAIHEIQLVTGCDVVPVRLPPDQFGALFNHFFGIEDTSQQDVVDMRVSQIKSDQAHISQFEEFDSDGDMSELPVVKLLNSIFEGAIEKKASDIHLEPQDPEMRVRYRVDGILHDVMLIPKSVELALISRAKILADMDITEKRRPQDGHYSVKYHGEVFDIRMSCMPTVMGEKMVFRILDKSRMSLSLLDLGFSDDDAAVLAELIRRPYGMVLVTGPTGSGKTTSLYAMLNLLDRIQSNIVTIEDPVEYRFPGINQTQVTSSVGISFATGLRSFLRQDPNVIMVGEIRDRETAEIAIQAALTGHLVLSTLHTNDAPTAVTRLMDMGIEPYLIASMVIGVLAQRLARKICTHCHGTGCAHCFNTGMKGRTVLYEVMPVTPRIQKMIVAQTASQEIKALMIEENMSHFGKCADRKIAEGVCSTDEIHRVIAT